MKRGNEDDLSQEKRTSMPGAGQFSVRRKNTFTEICAKMGAIGGHCMGFAPKFNN